MKENFISMAPDEESNAKVSLIDQNKTLMIDQYTTDVEAGNPEFVEDIQKVGVTFTDEEGGAVEETLKFGELRDFEANGGKGRLVENSPFLSGTKMKIETNTKIRKSIEQNRKLRDILKEAGSREEMKAMLQSMLDELNGAE